MIGRVRHLTERHPHQEPPQFLAAPQRVRLAPLDVEEAAKETLDDVVLVFPHPDPRIQPAPRQGAEPGANRSHSLRAAVSRTDGSAAPSAASAAVIEPVAAGSPDRDSAPCAGISSCPPTASSSGLIVPSRRFGTRRPEPIVGPAYLLSQDPLPRAEMDCCRASRRSDRHPDERRKAAVSRVPHKPGDGNAAVVSEPAKKPFGLEERNEDCALEPTDKHRRSKRRRIRVTIPTNEEPIP